MESKQNIPAEEAFARILETVKSIPPGCVASYGQVAAIAGIPRRARLVGRVLSRADSKDPVPWHRVLSATGRISLPGGSEAAALQRQRLEAEGVRFDGDRVDLQRHRWRPASDAPVLD